MNIFGLGAPELILILVVFLLFFGKDKLPGLARSVGHSFNELKAGFKDVKNELEEQKNNKEDNKTIDNEKK